MKLKTFKLVPGIIAASVVGLVCLIHFLSVTSTVGDFIQRLELISYDWRVREANKQNPPVATNLAAVFIDDDSLQEINDAYQFVWPWPRFLHGRAVRELEAQGATAIGFDVLMKDLQPSVTETSQRVPGKDIGSTNAFEFISSDEFLALELSKSSNVVLAAMGATENQIWKALMPTNLFRTTAWKVGHIITEDDSDNVVRRARAYRIDPEHGRIWHLGIILAARALEIDLDKAVIEKDRIVFTGKGGLQRILPVDRDGVFYIDWCLNWNDPRLLQLTYLALLNLDEHRRSGKPGAHAEYLAGLRANGMTRLVGDSPFRDKIVIIGSTASGNNVSDPGATPIEKHTYLVSKHWNVANSMIVGRFIQRSPLAIELFIILLLGGVAALLTWDLKVLKASFWVLMVGVAYVASSLLFFIHYRYWIPIVLPVAGALLLTHVCLVTYRVITEQNERQRVKAVFSKIVSPNVVNELLSSEKISLGGARRHITVYFADVRGFTEMTDVNQAKAEEYVREHKLTGEAAEAHYDQQAQETLATVNLYLAAIADTIKQHLGTLDKYIGDCVMAFWGAPTPNEQHALYCVRAAIDAQRSMYALNQERFAENKRREQENVARAAAGQPPLSVLPLLSLGSGINSGVAIVGLMGSDAHILNYTVFGREVNLASRLEGVSGRGRIIIGESTFLEIKRDDPLLAATCVELAPVTVKGIRNAVNIYEVPWKPAAAPAKPEGEKTAAATPRPSSSLPSQAPAPAPASVEQTKA